MAKGKALIKAVRAVRGVLLVPVQSLHSVMHVACVKADMIEQLSRYGDSETGYELIKLNSGEWCIDADHNVDNNDDD